MGNKYYDLAPGNVLQNMYIKRRLKSFAKPEMKFIEIGAGSGNISKILLNNGLSGIGYDLNDTACSINREKNADYIQSGRYEIRHSNFFDIPSTDRADIIISSHVLEHFPLETLIEFFDKCKEILNNNGRIITLVPSGMKYWGIEDETVGHYRRFEFDDFNEIAEKHKLKIGDISGLTYPLSNLLFKLSNYLIKKNESWKTELSKEEQTILSSSGGARNIKFKTHFPSYFRYTINELTMFPFYVLQVINKHNKSSMVIYSELLLQNDFKNKA